MILWCVVVSGMGGVFPVGLNGPTRWCDLQAERSGIGPGIFFSRDGLEVRTAGEAPAFNSLSFMSAGQIALGPEPFPSMWGAPRDTRVADNPLIC
jgi:hypothetical protein